METPVKRKPGRPRKKAKEPFKPSDQEGLRSQIQKVLLSTNSPLNLQELACEFLFRCDGVRGFIDKMMIDYREARPGSPERVRSMEFGAKLIQMAIAAQGERENYDSMADNDLERIAGDLMQKMDVKPIVKWIDHVCI